MKIRLMIMMLCVLALTTAVFAQKNNNGKGKGGNGGTAVSATTVTFAGDGGVTCTATFVRSASGIINETSRDCSFLGFEDVKIQFRPIGGTPNSDCDTEGLIPVPFSPLTGAQIAGDNLGLQNYFVAGTTYNVCAYLESASSTGNFTFDNGGFPATVSYTIGDIESTDALAAQGTLTYSDSRITYTIDVDYAQVVDNTTYLVGRVTSVNGQNICCQMGNYIFYKLVDNDESDTPDQVSGADLGAITDAQARAFVESMYSPLAPNPFTITSGDIKVY